MENIHTRGLYDRASRNNRLGAVLGMTGLAALLLMLALISTNYLS